MGKFVKEKGKPTKGNKPNFLNKKKQPKFPKKKPKLSVVFDDKSRVEFLTGFHKRKLQRKALQKTKLEKQLAAEKQRIRAEAKKSVGKLCSSHSILPEVEELLRMSSNSFEPQESTAKSYAMGNKIVTVSSLDNIHMKLPPLEPEESENDNDSDPEEDKNDKSSNHPMNGGNNIKSLLKKATNRLLQSSKAYKTSQKIKQKNKKGKNRHNNKNPNFVPRRDNKVKTSEESSKSTSTFPNRVNRKGKNHVSKKRGKGKK